MLAYEINPKCYALYNLNLETKQIEILIQLLQQGPDYGPYVRQIWIKVLDLERGDKCDPKWKMSFKYADKISKKWIYIDFLEGRVWLRKYVNFHLPELGLKAMIRGGYLLPMKLVDGPEQDLNLREEPVIWSL